MGLGKTLTMISLVLKELEDRENQSESDDSDNDDDVKTKYQGGTLIICPASLLNHWEHEVQKRVKRGKLSVELFHGSKRENKAKTYI